MMRCGMARDHRLTPPFGHPSPPTAGGEGPNKQSPPHPVPLHLLFDGEGCPKGGVRPPDTARGEIVRGSFSPRSGRRWRRWGSVRLRLTLWNVAVLALILGALGGVVRYTVQADLFAAVDQILAQRVPPGQDL